MPACWRSRFVWSILLKCKDSEGGSLQFGEEVTDEQQHQLRSSLDSSPGRTTLTKHPIILINLSWDSIVGYKICWPFGLLSPLVDRSGNWAMYQASNLTMWIELQTELWTELWTELRYEPFTNRATNRTKGLQIELQIFESSYESNYDSSYEPSYESSYEPSLWTHNMECTYNYIGSHCIWQLVNVMS